MSILAFDLRHTVRLSQIALFFGFFNQMPKKIIFVIYKQIPKSILRHQQLHYKSCSKFWSIVFVTFLVIFALFFANLFTVGVALVAKATRATHTVNELAKNSAKNDWKSDKHNAPKFTTNLVM